MQKLIKINTDHYVVVDDSEIKEGDYCMLFDDYGNLFSSEPKQYLGEKAGHHLNKGLKKITHSTEPLDKSLFFTDRVWGCEKLSLGKVKELIGEVDVEKKAETLSKSLHDKSKHDDWSIYDQLVYEDKELIKLGYNQALEDKKDKKYTEEDMWKAFEYGKTLNGYDWFGDLLESLQPKTEWEIEIVDGKTLI